MTVFKGNNRLNEQSPMQEQVSVGCVVWRLGLIILLSASLCAGCRKQSPTSGSDDAGRADAWFEEVAAGTNFTFDHVSGHESRFYMPEIMSGGVGLFDYDGDGDLDIYCVQGGSVNPAGANPPGNKLYRNLGDGAFEDVTDAAGVGDNGYGNGVACADYDADGDVDLYVTNVGPNVLYRNNGDGTFTDVTSEAGVGDESWGTSCAFVDYNGDGHLDLFIANYIKWSPEHEIDCMGRYGVLDYCSPKSYQAPAPDTLYRGKGDGRFEEVSASAGLQFAFGNGLGVAWADYNLDGRPDIYVANDGMPNQLWINAGDGTFTEEAVIRSCAVNEDGMAEAGMGVMAVDIDQDGRPDVFLSHLAGETNTLYVNEGEYFEDVTVAQGLGEPSRSATGFGLGFADFDHDGHRDIYTVNGGVRDGQRNLIPQDPNAEPNQLFRGLRGGRFSEMTPPGGVNKSLITTSRAAAFGDLDNDGDIDIVVINRDGSAYLLRNIVGSRGHWIMFRVLDKRGVDAAGAIVELEADGRRQLRTVQTAYSYQASNDPRVHFGLGDIERVDRVRVRWLSGYRERFGPFDASHLYELREGAGTPVKN